jgi:CDP-diacylglycerol--glycerol-3-phosphate 3-phosphatidyltransferase
VNLLSDPHWPAYVLAPFLGYFAIRLAQYMVLQLLGRSLPFDQEMQDRGHSLLLGQSVRQVFAWCMGPMLKVLMALRVRPNTLSILCFVFSCIGGGLIAVGAVALGGVVALAGSSLDYFDGRVARQQGTTSKSGSFLDSTLDRYGEVAFLTGAAVLYREHVWILLACLFAMGSAGIVSYTRAKAESLGVELKAGLMQRPERVVLFCLAASLGPALDLMFWPGTEPMRSVFGVALVALGVLTTATSIQRTMIGFRTVVRQESADKDA